MKAMDHVLHAIDKVSITLMGFSIPPLFVDPTPFTAWLGGIAIVTTIVYNAIRIVKELKNKNQNG
jgi:hypothetical protein